MRTPAHRSIKALLALLMLVLAGCNVQLEVAVDVEEDGSGTVTVGVGLDQDAITRFPAMENLLITSDLEAAGWTVEGPPVPLADGFRWLKLSKPFDNPDELQAVLDEIFGPEAGVFNDWEIIRIGDNTEKTFQVLGEVDLERGLELFSDDELNDLVDEAPLGTSIAAIEADLGVGIDEAVSAQIVVNLPDSSGEPVIAPLGEITNINETATSENQVAILLGWVRTALLILFGLAVVLAIINFLLDRRYAKRRPERRPERVSDRVPGGAGPDGAPTGPRSQMQMIVLDAHDVLFAMSPDPHARLIPFIREKGGVLEDEEIVEYHRQATLGRFHAAAFWQAVGVEGDPGEIDAEYLSRVRLQSGAKEFLREMHRRGVPVAVVTNDLAEWSYRLRDLHGLSGVAPWIVSSDIGVRKPDPASFEALRRLTGVPYHSMLIVDGQIPSLDMAGTLGMMTSWFTPEAPPADAEPGHAVITRFGDFFRRRRPAEPQRRRSRS